MKRVRKLLVFVVMLLFALVGCNCNGENNPPITEPTINKTVEKVIIKDTEVDSYDYKSLFTIKVGDEELPVIDDYINATAVKKEKGISPTPSSFSRLPSRLAAVSVKISYKRIDLLSI